MRGQYARFTIRSIMIAVALIALNLGAAIATWNRYSLQQPPPKPTFWPRGFYTPVVPDADGNILIDLGKLATGHRLVGIIRLPQPWPTLIEIWSPVIASVSITLVVILIFGYSPSHAESLPSTASGAGGGRLPRVWFGLRWATIAISLIGLNWLGVVYRPLVDLGEWQSLAASPFITSDFLDKAGKKLRYQADELVLMTENEGGERPATLDDYPLPLYQGDGQTRVLATIVHKSDGSVGVYEGNPGLMRLILSRPRVIQPPTRTALEIWWPVIASASTTLLVLDILWRQLRQRRAVSAAEIGEHAAQPDSE
jgi:hypothetical protein